MEYIYVLHCIHFVSRAEYGSKIHSCATRGALSHDVIINNINPGSMIQNLCIKGTVLCLLPIRSYYGLTVQYALIYSIYILYIIYIV